MEEYTSQDCSTSSTRRPLFTTVTPHDHEIRNILDDPEYTLNTYRVYNGSNYRDRTYTSLDTLVETHLNVIRLKQKLISFDQNKLFVEESCEDGLQSLDLGNPACEQC